MLSSSNQLQSLSSKPEFFKSYNKKVNVAIFSPMPEELEYIQQQFNNYKFETIKIRGFEVKIYEYKNSRILLAHTGLGLIFAASIVTLIHHQFSPDFLFLIGTAGAVSDHLKICDVVIAENAYEAEIQGAYTLLKNTPFESCLKHPMNNMAFPQFYSADNELLNLVDGSYDGDLHKGTVVSSNTFPAPQELYEKIKKANTLSIDMETSAFYQTAWLLKAKALAVRGISNILNYDGSDDKVAEANIPGSAMAASKVIMKIINKLILKNENEAKNNNPILNSLIKKLNLTPHPEGGYYSQTYKSKDLVTPNISRYQQENRSAGTAIYYLLNQYDFSAWHSLKSDEIWHFYSGSSLKLFVLGDDGLLDTFILGNPLEHEKAQFQIIIPAGKWFAAEVINKNSYSLVGCTVSPGFEFKDFVLAERESFIKKFPQHKNLIVQFTRLSNLQMTYSLSNNTLAL